MAKKKDRKPPASFPWASVLFLSIFVLGVCVAIAYNSSPIEPVYYNLSTPVELSSVLGKRAVHDTETLAGSQKVAQDSLLHTAAFVAFPDPEVFVLETEEAEEGDDREDGGKEEEEEMAPVPPLKIDPSRDLFAGLSNGHIVKVDWQSGAVDEVVATGSSKGFRQGLECGDRELGYYLEPSCGRPMGLSFDMDGLRLIVADAYKGIFQVDVRERILIPLTEVDHNGDKFTFLYGLAVSRHTNRVYFTEASSKYQHRDQGKALLEGRGDGKLYMYNPEDGTTHLLLKKLYFPTGVVIVENKAGDGDDFLLFSETLRGRVRKFSITELDLLNAKNNGKPTTFLEKLPGQPWGMAWDEARKEVWLTTRQRSSTLDSLSKIPWARSLLALVPHWFLQTVFPGHALILKIDLRKGGGDGGSKVVRGALSDGVLGEGISGATMSSSSFGLSGVPHLGRVFFAGMDNFIAVSAKQA